MRKLIDLVPVVGMTRMQVFNRRRDFEAFRDPGKKVWYISDEMFEAASLIGAGMRLRRPKGGVVRRKWKVHVFATSDTAWYEQSRLYAYGVIVDYYKLYS